MLEGCVVPYIAFALSWKKGVWQKQSKGGQWRMCLDIVSEWVSEGVPSTKELSQKHTIQGLYHTHTHSGVHML
jgi:hypothetical protein